MPKIKNLSDQENFSLKMSELTNKEAKNDNSKEDKIITHNPTEESKKKPIPLFNQILLCFSIYSNSKKILSLNQDKDQFTCFHGIRVISCIL